MTNETTITVRGFAGTDPMLQATTGGESRTSFRIGSTRSHRSPDGEWVESPTVWFTVKVWGALAAKVCQSVRRGTPLLVRGRIEQESWLDREGNQRTGQALRAETVAIDLSLGQVTYQPPRRPGQRAGELGAQDGGLRREDSGGIHYADADRFVGPDGEVLVQGQDQGQDRGHSQGLDDLNGSGSLVPDTAEELTEAPF